MEGGSILKHHKRYNVFQWRRCRWRPVSSRPKINQITLCHYFVQMSQCKHLSHNKAHSLMCKYFNKNKRALLGSLEDLSQNCSNIAFFITAEYTRTIAFSANLTEEHQSGVLKFVAFFSVGGGFDNESHVFTAPIPGTYFFAVVNVNLLG